MADTASLIARVKTEGADVAAKQLDAMASSADRADTAVNKLTPDVNKVNTATSKAASDGFAKFRNAAGQVGFQVQDMVVQLQSGTSAFVAIGQQGSQLAGAFGPGGAVLGAVIALASAIGGVLYKSLTEAEGSSKDLEAAQKQLKDTFQQTASGSLELTDGLIQLTQISREAAETQLALAKANADLIAQQTAKAVREDAESWETWKASTASAISQYDALVSKGADVGDTLEKLGGTYEGNIVGVNMLAQNIAELSSKFGVNRDQALEMIAAQSAFNKEPTAENARRIADVFTDWLGNTKQLNPELIRLTDNANKNATALENAEKSANAAAEAQKNLGRNVNSTTQRFQEQNEAIVKNQQIAILSDRERIRAQAEMDKQAFAKREAVTKEQIAAYNAARDAEAQQDIARIDKTEKEKADREAKSNEKRLAAQAKREETAAQRQKKAAEDFLATVDRTTGDEISRITAAEEQKLAKLEEFNRAGAISQQQYEAARLLITTDAARARQKVEDSVTQKQQKITASVDPIAKLQQEREARLKVIDEYEQLETANHETALAARQAAENTYNKGLRAAAEENFRAQSMWNDMLLDGLDAVSGATTNSIVGLLNGTQSAEEAAKNLGNALLSSVVGSLVEMGAQYLTNMIIGQTANAAMVASSVASGAAVAAAWAPAAAMASLASFGANAAPAAAGISSTTALAAGLALTGVREQGGQMNAGGSYLVGERGPEIIRMPWAGRAVNASQTRQQLNGNSSRNGGDNVTIVNNTTGRVDSAVTERDDEGRLRIIISETVASQLQDNNSPISKARRATRGQPGY